jgi:hypothetical protein
MKSKIAYLLPNPLTSIPVKHPSNSYAGTHVRGGQEQSTTESEKKYIYKKKPASDLLYFADVQQF